VTPSERRALASVGWAKALAPRPRAPKNVLNGLNERHRLPFRGYLHMMTARQHETFLPVTLGQIRGHGCRNLLVYCESLWCNHSAVMNADALPDEIPVRSLCPRTVCTACGLIGADVRPDWSPRTNRRPA
jgi:hypothetical protein